jgi:hypothetical protein
MHRYVTAIVELLQLPDGPDELGVRQLCDELDDDPDMYSAVWAHLYNWQRNMIRDLRANDRRKETGTSISLSSHDG